MRWQIVGGTRAQRRAVTAAVRGLDAALELGWEIARRADSKILIGDNAFSPQERDWLGASVVLWPSRFCVVALRPSLTPAQIHAAACHEFGHVLGLQHARTGLMAPRPTLPPASLRLTPRIENGHLTSLCRLLER